MKRFWAGHIQLVPNIFGYSTYVWEFYKKGRCRYLWTSEI